MLRSTHRILFLTFLNNDEIKLTFLHFFDFMYLQQNHELT